MGEHTHRRLAPAAQPTHDFIPKKTRNPPSVPKFSFRIRKQPNQKGSSKNPGERAERTDGTTVENNDHGVLGTLRPNTKYQDISNLFHRPAAPAPVGPQTKYTPEFLNNLWL